MGKTQILANTVEKGREFNVTYRMGIQCNLQVEVNKAPERATAVEVPMIPDFWDREIDLSWEQSNNDTLQFARDQVRSIDGENPYYSLSLFCGE